ncbi:MAG: 50S ribosomal protein L18 [Nitriliruptorales bacterium]
MDPKKKQLQRQRRHQRLRRRIHGTAERPRLSVYRSNAHIYAQLIDDERGHTLVSASSRDGGFNADQDDDKSAVARKVGELVAQRAREAGISQVVFDRGGFQYAGRVRALAEAARDAGLEF